MQGQRSKQLECEQTVYLSVYERDSQRLRNLDVHQQPQLSMVNALVNGKEVAVGAGAMVCCPVVLPLALPKKGLAPASPQSGIRRSIIKQ